MNAFTIGKVARATGVSVETIRFYERRGLIAQPNRPKDGSARDYDVETVARLRFIRHAKDIGFSLAEVAELLALRDDRSAGCATVRAQAISKRRDIKDKLEKLKGMRDLLDDLIAACPGEGHLSECTILEAMESDRG
ncbi:MerR family transcriptional regulator, mercuric resistance operon regulatory protein [Roseovarius azorensis]|uniref:MerR family transcriptional regulator, mercuric resistance operon regulatory protein n=1 Tax=Roseovarius azorensis TaxID=1287727 RepID=A0A1H7XBL3_9RHOB|nr:heavy metal-responsive transcriptional regulator [Roseovarius azorensis]SEM30548.1 MerR family transcriptional regulator, mercuric resistance operon regulatory protein [Roseovarius azorensis]